MTLPASQGYCEDQMREEVLACSKQMWAECLSLKMVEVIEKGSVLGDT